MVVGRVPGPLDSPITHDIFSTNNSHNVMLLSLCTASCSVAMGMLTFYWFCRMKKRFRHKLIMCLILGDLIRALFYFLFAAVTISGQQIRTSTPFCQTDGFFVAYGTEMSDVSILIISLHGALQILSPSVDPTSSGSLFRYRHYIYACVFILPAVMASLVFIRGVDGYMALGAFCSLPLRPFWYRLAFAWVPRYLIAFIILGLATAVYVHVAKVFNKSSAASKRLSTVAIPDFRPDRHDSIAPIVTSETSNMDEDTIMPLDFDIERRASLHPSYADPNSRRPSAATTFVNSPMSSRKSAFEWNIPLDKDPFSVTSNGASNSHNRLSNGSTFAGLIHPPSAYDPTTTTRRLSAAPSGPSVTRSFSSLYPRTLSLTRSFSLPFRSSTREPAPPPSPHPINATLITTRLRFKRQLRLLFIYPIIYIFMWIPPFVLHCMQYYDHWAQNPPFGLASVATFCLTFMGCIDATVFCLRERPWRYIPGRDGATGSSGFWRSFMFWEGGFCRWSAQVAAEGDSDDEYDWGYNSDNQHNNNGQRRGSGTNTNNSGSKTRAKTIKTGLKRVASELVQTSKDPIAPLRRMAGERDERLKADAVRARERLEREKMERREKWSATGTATSTSTGDGNGLGPATSRGEALLAELDRVDT
ncbi:hypothetical protein K402DRAFT_324379 [Aulographum hederae CBS 113979]|uniref:Uncharacterized protein n=1 Tax=Aulographum hederae CBS 113979 TaxID=1176131 RepID=A0A6G1HCX1_9PEZI|nr:hypothetical protein K402DRAFT_324379 [Aulographum hederae CBS 113979]